MQNITVFFSFCPKQLYSHCRTVLSYSSFCPKQLYSHCSTVLSYSFVLNSYILIVGLCCPILLFVLNSNILIVVQYCLILLYLINVSIQMIVEILVLFSRPSSEPLYINKSVRIVFIYKMFRCRSKYKEKQMPNSNRTLIFDFFFGRGGYWVSRKVPFFNFLRFGFSVPFQLKQLLMRFCSSKI